MLRKLGFVIVLLLFGALMFVAGLLAPSRVREPVADWSHGVVGELSGGGTNAGETAAATGAAGDGDAFGGNGDAEKDGKGQPYADLVLPTPLPPKGRYALQVEILTGRNAARPLVSQLDASDHEPRLIPVTDPAGDDWFVVAAGRFGDPDAARTARPDLKRALGSPTRPLPVILLPEKKKKDGKQSAGQGADAAS